MGYSKGSDPVTFLENQSLDKAGGSNPSVTSEQVVVEGASSIRISGYNSGSSTDLDIIVMSNHKHNGQFEDDAAMNLNSGESDVMYLQPGAHAIKIKAVNNDSNNSTTLDYVNGLVTWR